MKALGFRGSGPGAQTADGCSVEPYRRLPPDGDIASALTEAGFGPPAWLDRRRRRARARRLVVEAT